MIDTEEETTFWFHCLIEADQASVNKNSRFSSRGVHFVLFMLVLSP